MKVPLFSFFLALLCLAPGGSPPIIHHITLPQGGLPESWSVSVPQYPGQLSRVTIDLELEVPVRVGYEYMGTSAGPPWGRVISTEWPEVWLANTSLHLELLTAVVDTPTVFPDYDGVKDYDGPSGTVRTGTGQVFGEPTQVPVEPWEGSGSVQLEVVIGGSGTGFKSYGWPDGPFADFMSVSAGGELIVTYWP